MQKAQCVNIIGADSVEANKVIDNLKEKERLNCENVKEDNPDLISVVIWI